MDEHGALASDSRIAMPAAGLATQAGVLGTKDQLAKEALALRIFASAPMRKAQKQLEALLREDFRAATPSGQATLQNAAQGWAMQIAMLVTNQDTDRPVVMWSTMPAHKWFGIEVPRASSSGEHTDNVYRNIPISGAASYEIRGRLTRPGPAQVMFALDGPPPGNTQLASGPVQAATHLPGCGMISSGHFAFGDDEAVVITVDRIGAASLNIALSDPWGPAFDYAYRNGSLNHAQAHANGDGSYTYVIAPGDPGIHNLLDTSGVNAGRLLVRWQGLLLNAAETAGAGAVRTINVVKLKTLKKILPPETVFVTAEERKSQLATRAASYDRRLKN